MIAMIGTIGSVWESRINQMIMKIGIVKSAALILCPRSPRRLIAAIFAPEHFVN